ncbi:MAG: hypothetical protein HKN25_14805 [Pyrinomonadaceae bacterium]|nr:hypothetical protein [Pyrinomonadaceae bacterium]
MKIKNLILFTFLFCLVGALAESASAQLISNNAVQCSGDYITPIKCGYHAEGYQDGMNDARANRDYDYKRYKRKYEDQYESYYRDGYDRGYRSINPNVRWTGKQRDVYNDGYDDGDKDKDRGISRLPARYEGQYDRSYEEYYRKGYLDGYDRRPKQYDVAVGNARRIGTFGGNTTTVPIRNRGINRNRRGTRTGTLTWTGRVDARTNLVIRGSTVRTDAITGRNLGQGTSNWVGVLPRRQATVVARRLDGRGSVIVTQQPTRANNFTTIVSVNDTRRGSDNYRIQVSWQASNTQEAYSQGKVMWRGRVDQTANITISGEDVSSFALSGRALTNVTFDLDGYLARRRGNVSVRKLDGRGTVTILEQPSRQNDYVAVIQVFDPKGNDDFYEIEVTW